jgi:hypothetical protein
VKNTAEGMTAANRPIRVLELRNYVTKPGQRDKFISYFETKFIDSMNADSNRKLLTELREIVTTKTTVILHPTKKSFSP